MLYLCKITLSQKNGTMAKLPPVGSYLFMKYSALSENAMGERNAVSIVA